MAARLDGSITVEVTHKEWAGTNQAHVTLENVHELGQLVEAQAPDPCPDPRHPLLVWKGVAVLVE